jgi:hypothetical protein
MQPPLTEDELIHADIVEKLRLREFNSARAQATHDGLFPMRSEPHSDAYWQEVVLTPMGHFMVRDDFLAFARALRSRVLFAEAITIDEHWGSADPEDLGAVLQEFETLAVGHRGPRHGKVDQFNLPWDELVDPYNTHREAA